MKLHSHNIKNLFRVSLLTIFAIGMLLHPGKKARANTLTVVNNHDTGPGSLRYLIDTANSGDTIKFAEDFDIYIGSTMVINKDITIDGTLHTITIHGNTSYTVFQVNTGSDVMFDSLIINDGDTASSGGGIINSGTLELWYCSFSYNYATMSGGKGGAIYNIGTLTIYYSVFDQNSADSGGAIYNEDGTLEIYDSIFQENDANYGGAIYNDGYFAVLESTFEHNVAATAGGGLYSYGGSDVYVINSTFFNNSGSVGGGGIYTSGPLTLQNSTIANNTGTLGAGLCNGLGGDLSMVNTIITYSSGSNPDCYFAAASTVSLNLNNFVEDGSCSFLGVNFLTGNPNLGPLANNGSFTKTMALLPNSGAIDAGDDTYCYPDDQRGITRPQGFHCDIGAYELVQYLNFLPLVIR